MKSVYIVLYHYTRCFETVTDVDKVFKDEKSAKKYIDEETSNSDYRLRGGRFQLVRKKVE